MKKLIDLTKDEVVQIVTDIFNAKKVSCIKYNKRNDEIECKIYTEWEDEEGVEIISDELIIRNPFEYGEYCFVVNFPVTAEDIRKLKQFCYAKEIYGSSIDWIFDNPYINK